MYFYSFLGDNWEFMPKPPPPPLSKPLVTDRDMFTAIDGQPYLQALRPREQIFLSLAKCIYMYSVYPVPKTKHVTFYVQRYTLCIGIYRTDCTYQQDALCVAAGTGVLVCWKGGVTGKQYGSASPEKSFSPLCWKQLRLIYYIIIFSAQSKC